MTVDACCNCPLFLVCFYYLNVYAASDSLPFCYKWLLVSFFGFTPDSQKDTDYFCIHLVFYMSIFKCSMSFFSGIIFLGLGVATVGLYFRLWCLAWPRLKWSEVELCIFGWNEILNSSAQTTWFGHQLHQPFSRHPGWFFCYSFPVAVDAKWGLCVTLPGSIKSSLSPTSRSVCSLSGWRSHSLWIFSWTRWSSMTLLIFHSVHSHC